MSLAVNISLVEALEAICVLWLIAGGQAILG
jgi:hypothetical protein